MISSVREILLVLHRMAAFSQTLSTLTLDQNPIGDAGVQQLADALTINKTLITLSLNRTDIGAASARSLADVLKVNRTPDTRFPFLRRSTIALTTLNLHGNQTSDAGVAHLADPLQVEQSKTSSLPDASLRYPTKALTTLNLGRTGLSDEGARYLAQALTINKVSRVHSSFLRYVTARLIADTHRIKSLSGRYARCEY